MALLLLLTLLGLSFAHCGEPSDKSLPVILSGCEIDYPPFCIVKDGNKADGFSVELLRAALKAMQRDVNFTVGTWVEVKQALEDGKIQVLPLVGRTPEREGTFDFTFPYLTLHGAIVVREDNKDIENLSDLRGKRITVLKGDNSEEFVRRRNLGATITTTTSSSKALQELAEGKCDAVVMQRLLALRLIREERIDGVRCVNKPLLEFSQSFCFAVREGNKDLLAALNEGLATVIADGTFQYLSRKWFAELSQVGKSRIVVGGDMDYPPYEFLDENGQPSGYNVELTRAIAKQIGVDVYIKLGPWSEIRKGLDAGDIDLVHGMFYSLERDKQYMFSQSHAIIHHVAVCRKGEPCYNKLSDLKGKRILAMRGDIMHDYAVENGFGDNLILVDTQEDALRKLSAGEGDCALVAKVPALYWLDKLHLDNLNVSDAPLLSLEYCYAGSHQNRELVSKFSEGLTALEKSGEYRKIHDKWLGAYTGSHFTFDDVLNYMLLALVPVSVLLLGALLWSQSLRRQVTARTVELKKSRDEAAFFRELIEQANDAVFVIEPSTSKFLDVNRQACESLGYSRSELLQLKVSDIEVEVFNLISWDAHVAELRKQGALLISGMHKTKSGEVFPVEVSIAIAGGDMELMIALVRDVSDRVEAERKISALAKFPEENPNPVLRFTLDGMVVYSNKTAESLAAEWTGGAGAGTELLPDMKRRIENVYASGQMEILEATVNNRIFRNNIVPVPGMNYVNVYSADITERKRAEEDLISEKQFSENLINTARAAILMLDPDGKIVLFNPYLEELTGYAFDEVKGLDWFSLFIPNSERDEIKHLLSSEISNESNMGNVHAILAKDGKSILIEWYNTTLKGSDGNTIGVLSVGQDVTERQRMEDQLRQSEKMQAIGQLAGGIAHDFNNQLSGVLGYADMLSSKLEDEKLKRYVDNIMMAGKRAADLTKQLLAFSRKGKYLSMPVDIDKVLSEVVAILEHSIDKRISISQILKARPSVTLGDPTQLQNVFLNLALNARDAMPEGGSLIFETDISELKEDFCKKHAYSISPGVYLKVSVTDSGCGISEDVKKHMFEPFYTTKGLGEGTGMGLASVYGTVRSHHGAITVYSEEGHGTTFHVFLPLSDHDGGKADRHEASIVRGTARILIVDDEEVVRELGSEMLRDLGYKVVTARDGKEAVKYYARSWRHIDLVILDMVMPVMSGRDTFIAMREINPDIRAILSSGYSINGEAQSILDDGVMEFVGKPFVQAQLSDAIARVLGKKI
ncbi:MAG: transporter substrate-binding domain-containing protein [Planctomycetes bacterium]|nr:transporter substrate-binding domain-containing protein [Planctomycetota bacterium]